MSVEKHSEENEEVDNIEQDCVPDYDERFFGDGTPNTPPQKCVEERRAINVNIIDNEDIVAETTEFWTPELVGKTVEVIEVVFNDGSVWRWPLRPWDKDYQRTRIHFVEEYVPDVIRHRAEKNGEDPEEVLKETVFHEEDPDPEWADKVTDTEISEENRVWFNENADYIEEIHRTLGDSERSVELDVEDDSSWRDDW